MMMGNHVTTSAFMMQQSRTANYIRLAHSCWASLIVGLTAMLKQALVWALKMCNQISIKRSCKGGEPYCTFGDSRTLNLFALLIFLCYTKVFLEGFLFGGFCQLCTQCPCSAHASQDEYQLHWDPGLQGNSTLTVRDALAHLNVLLPPPPPHPTSIEAC